MITAKVTENVMIELMGKHKIKSINGRNIVRLSDLMYVYVRQR